MLRDLESIDGMICLPRVGDRALVLTRVGARNWGMGYWYAPTRVLVPGTSQGPACAQGRRCIEHLASGTEPQYLASGIQPTRSGREREDPCAFV